MAAMKKDEAACEANSKAAANQARVHAAAVARATKATGGGKK
jgi:hypothetical protein